MQLTNCSILKYLKLLTHWDQYKRLTFHRQHFQTYFLERRVEILMVISLKCVVKGQINNIPALVQIMAWCQPGNKPFSETMMENLLMHLCVTLPQLLKEQWILTSVASILHCYSFSAIDMFGSGIKCARWATSSLVALDIHISQTVILWDHFT